MQILDALERYLRGEMSPQEAAQFEELRRTNPEIDQLTVEHTYFLNEVERFEAVKNFKHAINEVEAKLTQEGIINKSQLNGKAKVVYLWKKYKRNIAVAASIALLISLFSSGIIFNYSKRQTDSTYEQLVGLINKTQQQVNEIKIDQQKSKVNVPVKVQPDNINYRGTGFLIDGRGYLVTNFHVLSRMKNIYVENNKGEYFTATAVYTDNTSDLAILKIADTSFKTINSIPYSIKKSNADLSEQFFTLGFPRNEVVYGEGYVSAQSGNDDDSTAYQLNVSANPGNSGAPVINKNGELIGIITAKDSKADGVVYAAKSKNIVRIIDELKRSDTSSNQTIKIPSGTALKSLDRAQQVKKMQEFVYMVVGN
ncbi:S1C family serine protease [Ferruginibacter albus]|uniref:S1C family serine protease n=1 Tax=Ferruginibacter albus TaxID=2875540 RepID=UPI001CC7D892|nr:S1C family serine protease [Ferruginibacter albus]UAY53503.1 S1C family serine protease [Ferruginibacter albus]